MEDFKRTGRKTGVKIAVVIQGERGRPEARHAMHTKHKSNTKGTKEKSQGSARGPGVRV